MRRSHLGIGLLAITLAVPVFRSSADAFPYLCPDDPGFCYFDTADDGCFDSGTDVGPIDDELSGGPFPDPLPPGEDLPATPGSIICPPSVKQLDVPLGLEWRTALGSRIVLHEALIRQTLKESPLSAVVRIHSGADLVLGGGFRFRTIATSGTIRLRAEESLVLEGSLLSPSFDFHYTLLEMQAVGGDVTIGPGSRIVAASPPISAPSGKITLLNGVRITDPEPNSPLSLTAGGDVEMTNASFTVWDDLVITGQSVTGHGRTTVKAPPRPAAIPQVTSITASGGSVHLDQVSFKIPFDELEISGHDITIPSAIGGKPKPSVIDTRNQAISLSATGSIAIDRAKLKAEEIRIETTGTAVDVTQTRLQGRDATTSTVEVEAGPGSVCDLTGSDVVKASLTTSCDTVIGP